MSLVVTKNSVDFLFWISIFVDKMHLKTTVCDLQICLFIRQYGREWVLLVLLIALSLFAGETYLESLLLTWINFKTNTDKKLHPL